MSVLVVGVSHRSAPVSVLEKLALDHDGLVKLVHDAASAAHVGESAALATCNRIEVYTEVDRFHGSVEEVSRLLVQRAGEPAEALVPHLYVHYDDGAVSHLFHVATGLDSMAPGESQILGQVRDALRSGQELGTVGPALNSLFQQALRVGKRAQAETDVGRAAPSLVSAALADADLAGARVLVVGAGSMAAIAVATAVRAGAAQVTVVNRSLERARRLAEEYGANAQPLDTLSQALAAADLVISCTGATEVQLTRPMIEAALADGRPLLLVDLAMPHDVDPAVAELPGVRLTGLRDLAERSVHDPDGDHLDGARRIVAEELAAYRTARRQASVTPTVVALRSMATSVVDSEVARLDARLPDLDPVLRAEVVHALRRVSDKLVHEPTVRVKELAGEQGAVSYAAALAELFALDPEAVQAVTRPVVPEDGAP